MRLIHLIRHARPSVTGVVLGRTDLPLSAGPIRVSALAVESVYSSPLIRARRTAEQMFPDRQITVCQDLAERAMGYWDGLGWEEIESRWPDGAAAAASDWFAFTPPGGEGWRAFTARVERAWRHLTGRGSIAIVAHAGVNAVLWHLISGGDMNAFRQDYEEVITLAVSD